MSTKISKYFTLEQLTRTSATVPGGNAPNATERANLVRLANNVLDVLYEKVGAFSVEDAFRNEYVNTVAGGSKTSYHRLGLACDCRINGGAYAWFSKIAADPELRKLCGELIVNSPNVVHVSIPNPNKTYAAMYRDANGNYIAFSKEALAKFIKDNGIAVSFGISGLAVVGTAIFFLTRKQKGA